MEICIWKFVAVFILAIILWLFLDGIIGQVNQPILQIFQCELFATRPDVPLLIPICLVDTINWCEQHISSNIEFSLVIKEGHQVFLDYVWAFSSSGFFSVFHDFSYFIKAFIHLNATALIWIFPRFYNPEIFLLFFLTLALWYFFSDFLLSWFIESKKSLPLLISIFLDVEG